MLCVVPNCIRFATVLKNVLSLFILGWFFLDLVIRLVYVQHLVCVFFQASTIAFSRAFILLPLSYSSSSSFSSFFCHPIFYSLLDENSTFFCVSMLIKYTERKEPRIRTVRCVTLAGARTQGLDNNNIIIRWCVVAGLWDLTAADAVACWSFPSDCLQADAV